MDKNVERWLRADGLALIAGWRRWGADFKEVASRMGVSNIALKRWAEAHEEIARALEIDSQAADFLIEEAVFNKALAGDVKAVEFWLKYRGKTGSRSSNDGELQSDTDYSRLAELINEI